MKHIMLILIITVIISQFPGTSHAYWYIVSKSGKVVAKCDYQPSLTDIASRGELAIYSDEKIELNEAEYDDKKITRHRKTAKELKIEAIKREKATEEAFINKEMRKMAMERLINGGHSFKHAR